MRTYTLLLSILVHMAAIGALLVVPIVATSAPPTPLRTTAIVFETPPPPPPAPPLPTRAPRPAVPTTVTAVVPVEEPIDLQPEPVIEAPDDLGVDTGVGVTAVGTVPGGVPAEIEAPPIEAPRRPATPMRVGGEVRPPHKTVHVAPEYPAIARSAGISGVVILEAIIAEDGTVREVKILRSVRLLDEAAVDAVRRWRFTPSLLNGQPVPVIMTVTVGFHLN